MDAEILARLSRMDIELLRPVYQRSEDAQPLRSRLRVRSSLVQARGALINRVRGTLRAQGAAIGSCNAENFAVRFAQHRAPQELRELLEPLVGAIGQLTERILGLEEDGGAP